MAKKNLLVICGGQSAEHEVSLTSAYSIVSNLDSEKYNPLLLAITKKGDFVALDGLKTKGAIVDYNDPKKIKISPKVKAVKIELQTFADIKIDAAFPIIHGTTGEDGVLQGFLKMLGIKTIGANTKSSAVCMDKHWTKIILSQANINCGKFFALSNQDQVPYFSYMEKQLGKTIFVKPASLGSSVGINKCNNDTQYLRAVKEAFSYDSKILIEKFNAGREIEIGVLELGDQLIASNPSEIVPNGEFYSYNAKYIDKDGAKLIIPAPIDEGLTNELKSLAVNIFKLLECSGMARVDFFLTAEGFVFNEINTLPGFTSISMYPKMFEQSNISYKELLTHLVESAK